MKRLKKPCIRCGETFQPTGKFSKICKKCNKKKNPTTEEDLNYEMYKDYYKQNNKDMRLLIKAFIKKCPKHILNQVLKEEKIIKRDWSTNGEQYGEYYDES